MNPKALTLAGVAVGVAAATAVILNLAAPIKHAEGPHKVGVTVDEVFGGALGSSPISPIASATAAEAEAPAATIETAAAEPATEAAVSDPASAPVEAASQPVIAGSCAGGGAPPAQTIVAAAEPEAVPESAPAEVAEPTPGVDVPSSAGEPAATTPVTAAGACSTAVSSGEKRVVVQAGGLPDSAAATPSADSGAEPAAPEPAAAPEPVAAYEPQAEVAEAAPKPAAKARKPKVPETVKKAWWPAKQAGKLNLTYAGEASFTKAVALLFDGAFETPASANQNIVVKNKAGKKLEGTWFVSPNKQMLLFNVGGPGVYTVEVGAGLTDKGNRSLGAASAGPVYVP